MISRRRVVLALGAFALTSSLASEAQTAKTPRRIGFLGGSPRGLQRLREALRRLGYEEGKDLVFEIRYADGNLDRLSALAEELVRLKVELIVAGLNEPIAAAKQATRTVPIVMHAALSPVENGFVESLGHPSGNVTGTMWTGPELGGKIVQILKEAAPRTVRIASLFSSDVPGEGARTAESRRAAKLLGMSLQEIQIPRAENAEAALTRIATFRPDALIVWGDSVTNVRAREIADFATKKKLVSIGTSSVYVEAGGLLFYGPAIAEVFDRTASFVDRILRGAYPGDLPVEAPNKYELVMNAKTALAIGFKPKLDFASRVDRLIE